MFEEGNYKKKKNDSCRHGFKLILDKSTLVIFIGDSIN